MLPFFLRKLLPSQHSLRIPDALLRVAHILRQPRRTCPMSPKSDSSQQRVSSSFKPSFTSPTSNQHTSAQPKSSRQQFSACGACRMRKVRCNLKDVQAARCSNCQERGTNCVDEFAEVNAVKLLRRGRELQQVEAVYGKAANYEERRYSSPGSAHNQPSSIPTLRSEFFKSHFFHTFLIQRPIIDPLEFSSRVFYAHIGNTDALGTTGQLICMVLATWATSFGINESGDPDMLSDHHAIRRRKERTNVLVRELLHLVDLHSLLRKPTWDGVRALLLIMPLTEDLQTPMERQAMYEGTINQVYTLCSLASVSSVNSGLGEFVDASVRARIFWYAYIHEGVASGLQGGRLLLSEEDFHAFQATLPMIVPQSPPHAVAANSYLEALRYSKTPIRLSATFRKVHAALTGPKARQRDEIDEERLRSAWDELEVAWDELDALRNFETASIVHSKDIDRFVNGWQIVIFECCENFFSLVGHENCGGYLTDRSPSTDYIIREALQQRLVGYPSGSDSMYLSNGTLSRSHRLSQVVQLHSIAEAKCYKIARLIVDIIRPLLGTDFFRFDASLVRNGCFFTGLLLAGSAGSEEEVNTCLQVLRDMRWAFAESEEREHTLKIVWEKRFSTESKRCAEAEMRRSDPPQQVSSTTSASISPSSFVDPSLTPPHHHMRQPPPPLSIAHASAAHGSGPSTASTKDGGGWGTISNASSHTARSHHSPLSASNSPPFLSAQPVPSSIGPKVEALSLMNSALGDQSVTGSVYYVPSDMDTFAYSLFSSALTNSAHDAHDLTPPHSSAGMSTSSASFYDSYYDTSAVFVSPPGTTRQAAYPQAIAHFFLPVMPAARTTWCTN